MKFTIKEKSVDVEIQTVILVLFCLSWSIYYYLSTVADPDGGAESVIFIKPLVIAIMVASFFVIYGAVKIGPIIEPEEKSADQGILHPRRLVFAVSIFIYAAALPFLGYLIPSLVYLSLMCLYLGLRNLWVFVGLWAGYTALLWLAFSKLMQVPIPIWPTIF